MAVRRKKKKNNTGSIIAALATLALIGFIAFQQKPKQAEEVQSEPIQKVEQPEAELVQDEMVPQMEIPEVFSEPDKQQQFEQLYRSYQSVFSPPASGSPIRVFKKSGSRVEGDLLRFTASGLVLSTPDGLINVAKEEMSDDTRSQLFTEDFSQSLAQSAVQNGIFGKPPSNVSDLFLRPQSESVIETRRFTADRLNARYGPSRRYADVPGSELFRGQIVHVVAETNAWICVKGDDNTGAVLGWIPKFSTFTLRPDDKATIAREVRTLMDTGFIVNVDPMKNEVLVDTYEWRITDDAAIEGQSRLLAFYCGHQRNSRLFWVDIRDALSNRRIAEYSESKGFKVF
jgi:hypothetical protein